MKCLEFRFKNKVGRHKSDYNVKIGGELINKVNKFKYLGSMIQENKRILEDVACSIRCGWMKWWEAIEVLCDKKSTIKDKKML